MSIAENAAATEARNTAATQIRITPARFAV
jgi:hypothetical protein